MRANSIVPSQNRLGEGPLWSVDKQTLFWVDIYGKCIESFTPQTNDHKTFQLPCQAGAVAFRKQGGFALATNKGFAFWDGISNVVEWVGNPEENKPLFRFNDGKVDPGGRFWAGTMYDGPSRHPRPEGSLYRLDHDKTIHRKETGILISNGIGWSPDHRIMYYTDSIRKTIFAYDYDLETGEMVTGASLCTILTSLANLTVLRWTARVLCGVPVGMVGK